MPLTMSYTVSAATEAAVSASISTPVGPVVRASAMSVIVPAAASTSPSTPTKDSASGWHRGISSEVRLAAWMPAIRATPITSPLGASPAATACAVAGVTRTTELRHRPALGGGLLAHVHHPRPARGVEMGQLGAHAGACER